jgi:hypothetical protein
MFSPLLKKMVDDQSENGQAVMGNLSLVVECKR